VRPFLIAVLPLLARLAACQKTVEQAPDIRPVRVQAVAPQAVAAVYDYSGEVRPRVESRLGFRVPGKVVSRVVDVGAVVQRGQVLATLDARDLQLAQDAARAQLAAARVDHNLAQADLKRFAELRAKGFISEAELDRRKTAVEAAKARLDAAEAQASQQGNQAGYATLVADAAGVVTGVEAEVGQVVAAGQAVIRVAPEGAREVQFAIPEGQVEAVRRIGRAEVRTWARPERVLTARIREIAPLADPGTRTFAARATLERAPADVLLGMTAAIRFVGPAGPARLTVPLSAVVRDQNRSGVWVLDLQSSTVALAPVTLGTTVGQEVVITTGLQAGQLVVTAGVHKLQPGQKVVRLADGAVGSSAAPATGSSPRSAPAPAGPPAAAGVPQADRKADQKGLQAGGQS